MIIFRRMNRYDEEEDKQKRGKKSRGMNRKTQEAHQEKAEEITFLLNGNRNPFFVNLCLQKQISSG